MERLNLIAAAAFLAVLGGALPSMAELNTVTGNLGSGFLLPNGKPDGSSCGGPLSTYEPLYYQLRTFTVSATGDYAYRDVGYLDDSDDYGTIDIEIAIYTGTPENFDPEDPRTNGCFFNVDDEDTVNLTAGVTYTLMVTSNDDDPNTGGYIFSLEGPGTLSISAAPDGFAAPAMSGPSLMLLAGLLIGAAARTMRREA